MEENNTKKHTSTVRQANDNEVILTVSLNSEYLLFLLIIIMESLYNGLLVTLKNSDLR